MFNKGPDAEGTCRGPRILGSIQIPNFNFSIISPGHNPLVVKSDATYKFFVAFKNSETGSSFNVPQSDGVVGGPTDDQVIVVLKTSNTTLVTIQCSDKFTR